VLLGKFDADLVLAGFSWKVRYRVFAVIVVDVFQLDVGKRGRTTDRHSESTCIKPRQ